MSNPYEILGVRQGASADEIKRAYKELVKKYHPDQYSNNPLSDLAEEKLKEINQAYDHLIKNVEQAGNYDGYQNNNSYGWNGSANGSYEQIRAYINNGNVEAAEQLLDRIASRDAEWHYLKGIAQYRKGWYNEAYMNLQNAINMNPTNMEYRDALNRINSNNNRYESNVYGRRGYSNNPDLCTICQCLYCSDCCCECVGGDLINCC